MQRVGLIHWNADEAERHISRLGASGYEVVYDPEARTALRLMRDRPPAAVVIDLSRLPAQGRDVGLALRHYKATRQVPLVFVGGVPEKVNPIKSRLPDAVYTPWSRIRSSLKRAIAHPPAHPVVPESLLEGYSGTPLPKKLGMKADCTVALIGAPKEFVRLLGELPEGVVFRRGSRGRSDLTIWFTKSRRDLERRVVRLGSTAGPGGMWIAWPKKSSGVATDLSPGIVRKVGLASGLVDYKVCSIDATWTGLKFTRRKSKSAG